MATQTGSIDLEATNAVKLAAEASVDNKLENYTTHSELSVEANRILGTVSETYSTESSVSSRFSTVNQKVNGLEITIGGKVDSDEPWVSWLHAGVDETTHEPYLAMGQDSDSPSVVYGNSAAKFYDGEGDAESNVVASFGANGAIIGNVESSHTSITSEVTAFHDANGKEAARISMSDQGVVTAWASYSVNPTTSWTDRTETGITPLPDFTLGDLELAVSVDDEMIRSYNISSFTQPQISFTYGDIDVKFQATKSGDTWTAAMSCRNRDMSTQPTVTFGLSWEHIGTAPMWKFGGASNQGAYSFSAGDGNQPTGEGAVTLGLGLIANRQAQVVLGKYNKPSQFADFIIGNGTNDANRSNALSIDSSGNLIVKGFIQEGNVVGITPNALQAWYTALGLTTETIYETSGITIKRFGRTVMVQCHGVTGTPNSNTTLANVDMSAYKPSYNASALVCDTQSTTHFARLWVSKDDGKPYLAFAGYSSSSTWYGTLTYIY